jgi:hypothetical protein
MKLNEQKKLQLHYYEGCNVPENLVATGVGNNSEGVVFQQSSYDSVEEIQSYYPEYHYKYNLLPGTPDDNNVLYNNNNVIHENWGSPSPGQVVKFTTCGVYAHCIPTCMVYIGPTTDDNNMFSFSSTATLDQIGVYNSCPECAGTEVEGGCTDPEANNFNEDAAFDDGSCDYSEEDGSWQGPINYNDGMSNTISTVFRPEKPLDKKPLQESIIKRLQKLAGIKKSKK